MGSEWRRVLLHVMMMMTQISTRTVSAKSWPLKPSQHSTQKLKVIKIPEIFRCYSSLYNETDLCLSLFFFFSLRLFARQISCSGRPP